MGTLGGSLLASAIAVASAAVLVVAGPRSGAAHDAAGVFPPWWSRSQVFVAAAGAGDVRSLGTLPFIVVVRDPDGAAQARLRAAGALFSVSPPGASDCGF